MTAVADSVRLSTNELNNLLRKLREPFDPRTVDLSDRQRAFLVELVMRLDSAKRTTATFTDRMIDPYPHLGVLAYLLDMAPVNS